ncbi:NAD(P)-dependent glycerol-3-phosphate dehydrogenase [Candidatus Woesearchaeota archaeon]|jgi:glycerol-3-phosphate dehydrogenase (NAD(P)+)|nr:NAD(P)-dependent glycerol-3-phosphate dehydrogenase [Candidatus Woesearchaeota archaeon]MBT7367618.1 NAD(P)-dependent glycerol-3-phosphate dehydrogenase [Candidatus Woesearchaeota archaeon]
MKTTILGGGSWGTALAIQFSKNSFIKPIYVWEFLKERVDYILKNKKHDLLPEAEINENIIFSNDINIVLESDYIFLVVPSEVIGKTVSIIKKLIKPETIIILASKGFDHENIKFLSEEITRQIPNKIALLYGPTHAEEVSKNMFSAANIYCDDQEIGAKIVDLFSTDTFKLEYSDDIIGAQVCAAMKNIYALFIGVLDGLEMGDNTKAIIMTHGLSEMMKLGIAMGAKHETFFGLGGVGDLIVTCTSKHSRNRAFGKLIGQGKSLNAAEQSMNMIAEGVKSTKSAILLAEKYNIELPLAKLLHSVLFENENIKKKLKKYFEKKKK